MRLAGLALGMTLLLVLVAACSLSGDKNSTATVVASPTSSATPIPLKLGTPIPVGPAPSPGAVDPSQFVMIDQWQAYQVPQYPGATVGQFSQLGATTVKNGGSLVLTTTDSVEKVIAYYRAAMPFLGWKEINSNERQATFTSKDASISISASSANGNTAILMILGDV
jgi:hypothetical protein